MNKGPMGVILWIALLVAPALAGPNWPQFRGSDSIGASDNPNLPDTWSTTENVVWQADIPGLGWASPIVWGNKIFVSTVIKEGEREAPKKGLYFDGNRPVPKEFHRWVAYCLDFDTGKVLWEKEIHRAVPTIGIHLKNTYASETPVTDGERVYFYFGNQGVYCYDLDGNEIWTKEMDKVAMRFGWGSAASPVIHKDRLYIVNDNNDQSYLMALDKHTGEQIWKVDREEGSNWATPYVWENEVRTEIVTPGTDKLRSYDLDGNLVWELTGMTSITIGTPYSVHGLLYVSSGYVNDRYRPLYAIRPGASGDITLPEGETSNEFIAWSQPQGGPYNPTTLAYGDYIYVLFDRGFFQAFDAKTGKEIYGRQRIRVDSVGTYGGFTSSPWAYDNKIFCMNEDGDTFVIQAGPEFKILGINSLEDMGMSTPALVRDSLIIRTGSKVFRIRDESKAGKRVSSLN